MTSCSPSPRPSYQRPLTRLVAEQRIVWPQADRVEAAHCGKYTFQPVVVPSSSSSSSENEDVNTPDRHDRGRSAASVPARVRRVYASSTTWLTHRAESVDALAPRCGIQIGDHCLALLPASAHAGYATTHARKGRSRGGGGGGATAAVRADAVRSGSSSSSSSDSESNEEDGRRTALDAGEAAEATLDAVRETEAALWGPAVDIRSLEDARALLRHSPFGSELCTSASAIAGPAVVRVVYWEPVGTGGESLEAGLEADENTATAPASCPSLRWSLWWMSRGRNGRPRRTSAAVEPDVCTAEDKSEKDAVHATSSIATAASVMAPLPLVLHARATSVACLQQALALSAPAATPRPRALADTMPPRRLADLLTGLYVRLAASQEWLALVDSLSGQREVSVETVQSCERTGGLVNPPLAVLEAVHASACGEAAKTETASPTEDASSAPLSALTSSLARVVVMLPGREQSFLVRWHNHQRRERGKQAYLASTQAGASTVLSSTVSRLSPAHPPVDVDGAVDENADDSTLPHGILRHLVPTMAYFSALTEFDGSDGFLTDVNSLGALPQLQILLLANNRHLESPGVRALARHTPSLRAIDLSGCSALSDEGAALVAAIPTLEVLSLSHTAITAGCVPLLASSASRRLRRLALDHCPRLAGAEGLAHALPHVVHFSAQRCGNGGATATMDGEHVLQHDERTSQTARTHFEDRALTSHMRHLSVQGTHNLTNAQPWLFGFPRLESLDLSFTRIGASSFVPPPSQNGMTPHAHTNDSDDEDGEDASAILETTRAEHHRTAAASCLTTPITAHYPVFLRALSVEGCYEITDLSAIRHLTALRVLRAGLTGVTEDGLAGLQHCPSLETVDLRLCANLQGISPLACLPSLKVLNLFGCAALTDEGLAPIAASASLRRLYLMDCHGLRDVAFLGKLPSLRRLFLRDTFVTQASLQALAEPLSRHHHHCRTSSPSSRLVELDIAECENIHAWPAVCTDGLRSLRQLSVEASAWQQLPPQGLGRAVRTCTVSANRAITSVLPTLLATPSLRQLHATALSLSTDALSATTSVPATEAELSKATTELAAAVPACRGHARHHALRALDLTHCEALREVDALGWFPRLGTLNLSNTSVTDASLHTFTANDASSALCRSCRRRRRHGDQVEQASSSARRDAHRHRPLRALSLQQCRGIFSTDALTASTCPHLHTLILSESNVQDDGLVSLAWCAQLLVLRLDGCKGVSQLAPLAHLARLEEIHANGTNVTTAGLAGLVSGLEASAIAATTTTAASTELRACDLSYPRTAHSHSGPVQAPTTPMCGHRQHTSNVQLLSVCGCPMIFGGIAPLAHLPRLRILNVSNCRNLTAAHFSVLRTLREARTASPLSSSSSVPFFPMLEVLDVSRCVLLEGSLEGLETMQRLKEVYTAGTPLAELSMPASRRLLMVDGTL